MAGIVLQIGKENRQTYKQTNRHILWLEIVEIVLQNRQTDKDFQGHPQKQLLTKLMSELN